MTSLLIAASAFGVGAFTWTFLEYALHDWYGHRQRGKNDFSREHLSHHADSHYFTPTLKKVRVAASVLVPLGALVIWLAGWQLGLPFMLGLTIMYVAYEVLHRRTHTHPPRNFYGRWARKHHLFHHFANAKKNHGVTTPIWDLIFRTYATPARIKVPERHAMPWLCDPHTGVVKPEYAADYEIFRRKRVPSRQEVAAAD